MAGHSTWRVTGYRITGAVPEEVRAGQSRPPDLAYTGQMRSSGQFRHAASSSWSIAAAAMDARPDVRDSARLGREQPIVETGTVGLTWARTGHAQDKPTSALSADDAECLGPGHSSGVDRHGARC